MPTLSTPTVVIRKRPLLYGLATALLLIIIFYFGKPVLMPLALSGLFAFLLNPIVNLLHRWRLPRAIAVMVVTLSVFTLLGVVGWVIGREFSSLAASLPSYKDNIRQRVVSFYAGSRGGVLDNIKDIKTTIEETTAAASKEKPADGKNPADPAAPASTPEAKELDAFLEAAPAVAPAAPPPPQESQTDLSTMLGSAGEGLGTVATVIVFVIFMLLRQQELRNRLMRLAGFRHVTVVTRAMDETGDRVGRYLLMQAFINSGYGIVLAVGLYFIGMPYVVLWGVLAALFRFIPYIGPVAVAVLPSVLSLAIFNDWQHPLMVVSLIAGLELITNMLVEPVLYGSSVGISEFALLVAIVFWTWMWGGIGLVMATPLTVCLVVMAKHVPRLEWVEILMGDDPKVRPYMVLYQRLLAGDEAEAEEYVLTELKLKAPMVVVDETLLPAIALAKRELKNNRLSADEEQRLHESVFRIMDQAIPAAEPSASVAAEGDGPATMDPESASPAGGALMLGRPLDDGADQAALYCFDRLLPAGLHFEVVPSVRLSSEFHAEIESRQPAAVLISATPPGSHSTVRLQVRRLRAAFPKLKIYVGRWGVPADVANAAPLLEAGATAVYTKLTEAEAALTSLLREAAAVDDRPMAVNQGAL